MQDPAAARDFYLTKLGFTASKTNPMLLTLPGKSGQMVEIVPCRPELGTNVQHRPHHPRPGLSQPRN
jgi:hypothetical protein